MAALTKTQAISLIALQAVATGVRVISAAQDVTGKFAATIFVHFGRRVVTALTVGARLRVEASSKGSGDGHWYPLATFESGIALAELEAATGTNAAAQNVITLASTANLLVGSLIYIDNTTIANSEWHRIKSLVTNTSITLEDNLAFAQSSGAANIYTQAEMVAMQLDLTAIGRLRAVYENDSGQSTAIEVHMVTGDALAG